MKRYQIMLAILLVSMFAVNGAVFASDGFDIVPVEPARISDAPTLRGPVQQRTVDENSWGYITILRRWVDTSNYYLSSGAEGDTFVTYLKPISACSLIFFDHEMYTEGSGTAFLWKPNPAWLAAYPTGRGVSRAGQYISPIGDVLAGPTPFTVTDAQNWNTFMAEGELKVFLGTAAQNDEAPTGAGEWRDGFLAGWVKGGALPQPLADNVSARGFCYTWFGGPWTVNDDDVLEWGYYNVIIENMVDVGVLLWPTCPPIISDVSQLPNTLDYDGEFSVTARVVDDDGWDPATEHAFLHYEFYDWDEVQDTTVVFGEDSVEIFQISAGAQTYEGSIDLSSVGLAAGDQVLYWVSCTDNDGAYNTTEESPNAFELIELLAPSANILWIDNGQFELTELNFYERGLIYNDDAADDDIEVYDAHANNGFDKALIDASDWDLILYTAFGDGGTYYMPFQTPVAGSAFETFLGTTSDLIFIDQDYFYGNTPDESVPFEAGDFAYDVFGINVGTSDQAADTVFEGEGSDAISAAFPSSDPFWYHYNDLDGDRQNWADYFTITGASADWFYGYNDANTYGSVTPTNGGGNAYYLGFNVDNATNDGLSGNELFWRFYTALLNNYYPIKSAPEGKEGLMVWSLSPAYPNPFNPSTNIAFTVSEAGRVTLEVFDITGRLVSTLTDGVVQAGQHTVAFDGQGLASGTYLVRMQGNGFNQARKIVLLK